MNELFRQLSVPGIYAVIIFIIFIVLIAIIYFRIRDNIRKREESYRRISMMVNMDELTHLYTRKFFHTLFEAELERAERYDRELSCAIFEIDQFNEIKDKYGEKFCDLVVQDIGELFTDNTRIHDICARYGDHSYATLMPESNMESAKFVCKRLRGSIEGCNFTVEGANEIIHITVSIGLASYKNIQEEEVTPDLILEMANKALNHAKENGGNTIECFTGHN